ncbi:MAG: hypothetical protein JW882_19780 [Deltaproteobacteria bacterium]|nr:hypothetical protein [Deltaproteobacteria bacterium]
MGDDKAKKGRDCLAFVQQGLKILRVLSLISFQEFIDIYHMEVLACTLRYDFATRVFAVKRSPRATALRPHGAIFMHRGGPGAMNVSYS